MNSWEKTAVWERLYPGKDAAYIHLLFDCSKRNVLSIVGTLVFEGTLAELVEGSAAVVASEAGCAVGTAAASEFAGTGRDWRPRPAMN